MDDIVDFRCCLCPSINTPDRKRCPPGGPRDKPESPCRFVNVFVDDAGIQVFVSKEGRNYVSIETLPKRRSFDEAQHDLNMYAIEKKWQRV